MIGRVFILLIVTYSPVLHATEDLRKISVCQNQANQLMDCPRGEVIYIEEALFGNFKEGGCSVPVEKTCKTDVTRYIESQCSGRRMCNVSASDGYLKDSTLLYNYDCIQYYTKSLEIQYSCKKYFNPGDVTCQEKPILVTAKSGFLSGLATKETRKGSSSCPWSFNISSSQTLLLHLWDFSIWIFDNTKDPTKCFQYAIVKDLNFNGAICSEGKIKNTVYSGSNTLTNVTTIYNEDYHFLLEFEVIECPPFYPPDFVSTVERRGHVHKLKCSGGNSIVFSITCENMAWPQVMRSTCSLPESTTSVNNINNLASHSTILIIGVIALAAIISLTIIFIGLYYLQACPFQMSHKTPFCSNVPTSQNLQGANKQSSENIFIRSSQSMRELYPMLASTDHRMAVMQRDYATTLQMRQMAGYYPDQAGWCPAHGPYYLGSANTIDRNYNTLKMKRNLSIPLSNCQIDHYAENNNMFFTASPPSSPFYHELDQVTQNIVTEEDPTFDTSAADSTETSAKIHG